jgi:hypothetical protein
MTVIRNNSISGINSITAQSSSLNFYDSTGNTLAIGADVTGGVTVATGATISGSTNTITASTNGSERFRIASDGKVSIGGFNPAVSGLSISNSSTNRGFEFDTASGFDSTSCIRAYDRPTTAYKSLGLTGSDIKFGINDVEKAAITSGGNIEIANGNLVFSTSGTGIDFSATANGSGTTDSELLDDYEEGSWTPTYIVASGTITAHSNTSGRYVKIGKSVYIWGYISYSSNSSASGNVTIGGLPFTSGSGYGQATNRSGGVFSIGNYSFLTNTPQFGNIGSQSTSIEPSSPRSGQDNGFLVLNFSDFDTRSNYSQFAFAGQYLT